MGHLPLTGIRTRYTALLLCFLLSGLVPFSSLGQSADLILTNGKIFTADSTQPYVEALAIKGNRILARGTTVEIEKLSSTKTKRINLAGKTVVPGFNDAHDHLGWKAPVGQTFRSAFSVQGPSKQAVLDSIARLVKRAQPGQWISGEIGLAVLFDSSMRKSLDRIAPHHPVALLVMWGHGAVLNGKALQQVAINETAADPLGGWYGRKPGSDSITGVLYEYAQWPLWQAISMAEPDNLVKALQVYAQAQVQLGITTVQDMSAVIPPPMIGPIYQQAQLPLRIRMIPFPGTTPQGRSLAEWQTVPLHPTRLSYVSGIKYLLDGTSLEGTALLKKPYPGRPNWYGRLDMPMDTIRAILQEALSSNRQLHLHIVGDSTLSLVLPLMKRLAPDSVWKTKRVRIEHNATASSSDLERTYIQQMGIILAHTPQYGHQSPLRSLLERGIGVAMAPDGLMNPFVNMAIVTAQQRNPKENLTREQAVILYTHGSAYAEFKEREKGMLKAGLLADLAVLSQDIFTVPLEQLPNTVSLLTMIDGNIVYQARAHMPLAKDGKKK